MRNKAQTAMEYLMTYGWAILIIIVVIAALYSLGVFSVKPSVACSPCFSYFAFRDYDKTTVGTCTAPGCLYLRNGARKVTIAIPGGEASLDATSCGAAADPCDPGEDVILNSISTTGSVDITIRYTDFDTGVAHDDTAKIHN